jgi:hypothetical protein
MADVKVEIVNNVNDVNIDEQIVTIVIGNSGPQGPRGNSILNGEGPPEYSLGDIGDFYIDTVTQEMYGPKNNIDWGNVVDLVTNQELGYVHNQDTISDEWTITHGLGFVPNITVVDNNGKVVEGSYHYPNSNTVVATFTEQVSGKAYLS